MRSVCMHHTRALKLKSQTNMYETYKTYLTMKTYIYDDEKYIFFSGTADVYSQFHDSEFKATISGRTYTFRWAEQFMMAYKAIIFADLITFNMIMKATSPQECKRLGRAVKNYDENIWSAVAEDIVVTGNIYKFTQNDRLRETLMADADAHLVEASHWDAKWGTGMNADNTIKHLEKYGVLPGKNLLGKSIMRARKIIIDESLPANTKMYDPLGLAKLW